MSPARDQPQLMDLQQPLLGAGGSQGPLPQLGDLQQSLIIITVTSSPVTRCLSAVSYATCAPFKSAHQSIACSPVSFLLSPLFSLAASCPHSSKSFTFSLSPSPNKPLAQTLLHVVCFLSGLPWRIPPKRSHFASFFKKFILSFLSIYL